jgi:hypothetical protein
MLKQNDFISPGDLDRFFVTDSPAKAMKLIQEHRDVDRLKLPIPPTTNRRPTGEGTVVGTPPHRGRHAAGHKRE